MDLDDDLTEESDDEEEDEEESVEDHGEDGSDDDDDDDKSNVDRTGKTTRRKVSHHITVHEMFMHAIMVID